MAKPEMYLVKRANGFFYFRRRVPGKMRGLVDSGLFHHSLNTRNRSEAVGRYAAALARSEHEIAQATVYYLRLTLQCCQLFLMLTCPRLKTGAYSTVIPFPNSTPEEVALWLIVEWWDNAGYYLYLRDTTSDEAIFSQQFLG